MTPADTIVSFTGPNFFLSNFFPYGVWYGGMLYPSTENAYQAAKSEDLSMREKFISISAGQAKRLGKSIKYRSDWENVKEGIMLELNRKKFSDGYLRNQLVATGDREIIEGNNHYDKIWGAVWNGKEWVGENKLGKILMQIRSEQ